MDGDLGSAVRDALAAGSDSLESVATRLGRPVAEVDVAVRRSIASGLVVGWQYPDRVALQLTQGGETEVKIRQGLVSGATAPGGPDLTGFVSQISQGWAAGQAAAAQRREAAEAHMLVGDTERDGAVETINTAYAENRISLAEVDRRTALALAANTRGDLAVATDDLPRQAPATPAASTLTRWIQRVTLARRVFSLVITVALAAFVLFTVWQLKG